jgi:hypothetical protein
VEKESSPSKPTPPSKEDAILPPSHPTVTSALAVCPITGMSHAPVNATPIAKTRDNAEKSPKPTTASACPFSPTFAPTEDDDKLPECAQQ